MAAKIEAKPARSRRQRAMPKASAAGEKRGSGTAAQTRRAGELEYRLAIEAALKSEVRRRRIADKVVRKQFQALAASLRSVLMKPKPHDFLRELLQAIVRECGSTWATVWHVAGRPATAGRVVGGFRNRADERRIEAFSTANAKSLSSLAQLYRSLAEAHRCTLVVKADDRRVAAPVRRFFREMNVQLALVTPLFLDDAIQGWIAVYFTAPDARIAADSVAFIEIAANQAALVLQLDELASAERRRLLAEERSRIARDMHDFFAQAFSGIMLQIEATRAEFPEAAPRMLGRFTKIRHLASHGIDQVRQALTLSQPTLLDQHSLSSAVASLAQELEWIHGVPIEVALQLRDATLSSKVEVNLFAIASEAIYNAIKHARATLVRVSLRSVGSKVRLEIRDDGCGFDPPGAAAAATSQFGLRSMRERAGAIGARLRLATRPQSGTVVTVTLTAA